MLDGASQTPRPLVRQYLVCRGGETGYALDISAVRRVERATRVRWRVEGSHPHGWLEESGGRMPVFSLERLFGLARPPCTEQSRVVVLETGGGEVALQVEGQLEQSRGELDRVYEVPRSLGAPAAAFFDGICSMSAGIASSGEVAMSLALSEPVWLSSEFETRSAQPDLGSESVNVETFSPIPDPRRNAQAGGTQGGEAGRIVLFSTRSGRTFSPRLAFGLSVLQVVEVIPPAGVTPVPFTPPWVQGLTLYNDRPVPVLDLDRRFGWSTTAAPAQRFVVARTGVGDELVCLAATEDLRGLTLPVASRPVERPPALERVPAHGIFEVDRETVVIPDVERIASAGPPASLLGSERVLRQTPVNSSYEGRIR